VTYGQEESNSNLAELLAKNTLTIIAGAHDALSARLAQRHGFDAIWVSSFGVTNALGLIDEGVITLTEMLDVAWRIRKSVDCPVVVDCDTGYGDEINARRLVREAAWRGISAVCLEDQVFPKRNTFLDGEHRLEDHRRFCAKITAASESVDRSDCLIIARTEALAQGQPVSAALDRAYLYSEAGADAIIIQHRLPEMRALESFATEWNGAKPLGVLATSIRDVGFKEMEQAGFGFVIYANQGLRAAVRAMNETYERILAYRGRQPADLALASMDEVLKLQSDTSWRYDGSRLASTWGNRMEPHGPDARSDGYSAH
jgi:phosphoenolpyruvate phosphomutase